MRRSARRRRPTTLVRDPSVHARLRRRWRSWLPAISDDLSDLLGKREIFWELQEIAKENPRITEHGAFFDWMCRSYISAATMSVRGFVDLRNDVHSLGRILYEILKHPGIINRRAHRALYNNVPEDMREFLANTTFNNLVGNSLNTLPQRVVRSDLRSLEDSTARIVTFTHKRIAHRASPGELRRNPVFTELDAAMNALDAMFCKYNTLLTASGMSSVFATRQYNWKEVLYEPWIIPGSKFHPDT